MHIAAFDATAGTRTSFDPGASDTVDALAAGPAGTLYVGGAFKTIAGASRAGLAALNPDGGATSWDPHPDGPVAALAVARGAHHTIGVGGPFNSVGSTMRNGLAAVDLSNGQLTSFNPDVTGPLDPLFLDPVRAIVASPDGSTLYVAGGFPTIGGETRAGLAAIATSDGSVESFDAGSAVRRVDAEAISADGSTLYVAGLLWKDGAYREGLGAIATATGTVNLLDSDYSGRTNALALSADGSTLYAGGMTAVDAQSQAAVIAISTESGEPISGFDTNGSPYGEVFSLGLSPDGSTLYAGGTFPQLGGRSQPYLVALDPGTGSAVGPDFQVAANPGSFGAVLAYEFSSDGQDLYIVGGFDAAGGLPRHRFAEVDVSTGFATPFATNLSGPSCCHFNTDNVYSLARHASAVVIGGDFSGVNGAARAGLAVFDNP
jgi:WD40 repeat protein